MSEQSHLVDQLIKLCEFSRHPSPDGFDVEIVFKALGELKSERIWSPEEAVRFRDEIHTKLPVLTNAIYDQTLTLEINGASPVVQLHRPGMNLIFRITESPSDAFNVKGFSGDEERLNTSFPLILFKIIEIAVQLPEHTLRVCGADDCENVIATLHKLKRFCSPRCRSRQNTRKSRNIAVRIEEGKITTNYTTHDGKDSWTTNEDVK